MLRELLGAYADRELPPETIAQIDAHLVGCAECRRGLEVHHALRARLAVEPPAAASPAFRCAHRRRDRRGTGARRRRACRRHARVASEPRGCSGSPSRAGSPRWCSPSRSPCRPDRPSRFAPASRALSTPVHDVPLLGAVVDDYARVSRGDLPGRARDLDAVRAAVSFPVEPLRAPNLRLLAAWTTDVRGEPAAVLAYRLRRSPARAVSRRRGRVLPASRDQGSGRRSSPASAADGRSHRRRLAGARRRAPSSSATSPRRPCRPSGARRVRAEPVARPAFRNVVSDASSSRSRWPWRATTGRRIRADAGRADRARTHPAPTSPDSLSPDSLAARLARAEAAIAALRQQLATESQSTVHTRSRLQLDLTGMIITNAFYTTGVQQHRRSAHRARAHRRRGGQRLRRHRAPDATRRRRDA